MKYALIGCGRIAANRVKAVANNDLEFVAVCDIDDMEFNAMLDKSGYGGFPEAKRYADYGLMLKENPDIELVAIATESGKHVQIALDCIDAGKNVIIEKPIAMSMADADEIVRRANEKGVKVSACHQNRFNRAIQKLRDALEAGRFGKLSHGSIHVCWNRDCDYCAQVSWRDTREQNGGCRMYQCIHGLDLLRWMMGDDVVEVYGVMRRRLHDCLEAEDVGAAIVKFANGAIGTIDGTTNLYPHNLEETLYLFGFDGAVTIGGTSTNNIDVWDFTDETDEDKANTGLEEHTSNVYGNGHTALYADGIDAIKNDRGPYLDAVAGRNALEMVLAIFKSQKTGMPVSLPLNSFSSDDMKDVMCVWDK